MSDCAADASGASCGCCAGCGSCHPPDGTHRSAGSLGHSRPRPVPGYTHCAGSCHSIDGHRPSGPRNDRHSCCRTIVTHQTHLVSHVPATPQPGCREMAKSHTHAIRRGQGPEGGSAPAASICLSSPSSVAEWNKRRTGSLQPLPTVPQSNLNSPNSGSLLAH